MAILTTHASRHDYLNDVNSFLGNGYKYVFTDSHGYLVFHKPDEPKLSADISVSVGDPEALTSLIQQTVIDNGRSLDSARDLPHKTISYNDWYGVRDIP